MSPSFCCRSAVRKRPLLLPFPAERKRKGPRGLSADQFLLPLSRQSKKVSVTQKFTKLFFRGKSVLLLSLCCRFRWRDFILFARCKENEARETRVGECPPRPPRTALRQRAVERHVETRSAKRLQTHRLTAVQTGSLFVSPLREEIPSRATPPVWRNAALAFR